MRLVATVIDILRRTGLRCCFGQRAAHLRASELTYDRFAGRLSNVGQSPERMSMPVYAM